MCGLPREWNKCSATIRSPGVETKHLELSFQAWFNVDLALLDCRSKNENSWCRPRGRTSTLHPRAVSLAQRGPDLLDARGSRSRNTNVQKPYRWGHEIDSETSRLTAQFSMFMLSCDTVAEHATTFIFTHFQPYGSLNVCDELGIQDRLVSES
jgi:hypothetical protein